MLSNILEEHIYNHPTKAAKFRHKHTYISDLWKDSLRHKAPICIEEKECARHADGDEAGACHDHHLELGEAVCRLTARIGEQERERQENVHGEGEGIQIFPCRRHHRERKHRENEEHIVLPRGA